MSMACKHCATRRERIRSIAHAIGWCCVFIGVVLGHSLITQWLR
jgi:hypothetical protein